VRNVGCTTKNHDSHLGLLKESSPVIEQQLDAGGKAGVCPSLASGKLPHSLCQFIDRPPKPQLMKLGRRRSTLLIPTRHGIVDRLGFFNRLRVNTDPV